MAYLNLHLDYFDHPKIKRLIRLLGRGSEVLPLKLWAYTARYFAKDGRLTDLSAQEIEHECDWWGPAGKFVEAMLEVRLLVRDGDTFCVHQWEEHEGHITAFQQRAKKGAEARWDKIRGKEDGGESEDASSNASSIPSSNAPTYLPTKPTHQPTKPPPPPRKRGVSGGGDLPGFEAFWAAWPARHPRKVDRAGCAKRWDKLGLETIAGDVIAVLESFKASAGWQKDGGEYIPMPMTWLNRRPWTEIPPPPAKPATTGPDDYGPPPPGYEASFAPELVKAIHDTDEALKAGKAGVP